jgi:hypothetical protein
VNPGYVELEQHTDAILRQNYPNPVSGNTVIPFTLRKNTKVVLSVYDYMGRIVKILIEAELSAGEYETVWDASEVSKGIYFYQLRTGSDIISKKMVVE